MGLFPIKVLNGKQKMLWQDENGDLYPIVRVQGIDVTGVTFEVNETTLDAIKTATENGASLTDELKLNAGTTADAAVSADTTGTISGKLRGIVKILADVWNSTRHSIEVREIDAPACEDNTNGVIVTEQRGTIKYQAAAAADVKVKESAGFLYGIVIGADVASAVIEISNHASDGDGNVQIYLAGSTLMTSTGGYVPINATFNAGITADLTNQTNVAFVYR